MHTVLYALQSIEKNILQNIGNHQKRSVFFTFPKTTHALGLIGERGVGKTTLLLQKRNEFSSEQALYFSADNVQIQSVGLFNFIFWVTNNTDITTFFIDELFWYSSWQQELKNCIDSFPQCVFYFSGSSSLALHSSMADIERRIDVKHIRGLSFREFLLLKYDIKMPSLSLEDIFTHSAKEVIARSSLFPEKYFKEYVETGFYTFGIALEKTQCTERLQRTLKRVIWEDLTSIVDFNTMSLKKIENLFYILSQSSPSEISILSLSKKLGVNHSLLENIISFLSEIGVIHRVLKSHLSADSIRKEYKMFLGNPNLYHLYHSDQIGTIRESFFLSAIREKGKIYVPISGDFHLIYKEKEYVFEIGGKKKSRRQIYKQENAFCVTDTFLPNADGDIPLWIFGCLE